jgi:hypothetical protein
VSRINKVIYVSLVVSHSWLIARKPPISINYKLVLMDSSLKWVQQRELIATYFSHQKLFTPVSETSYQVSLLPSEVPSEYDIN